jgi:hypothetical protein
VVFSVPGEVSVERKETAVKARGQATWETGGRGDLTEKTEAAAEGTRRRAQRKRPLQSKD